MVRVRFCETISQSFSDKAELKLTSGFFYWLCSVRCVHEGARWNPAYLFIHSFICLFIFITHKRENSEKKENNKRNRNQGLGICLEGTSNAREPHPPWAFLGVGVGGDTFSKITFWGALEAKKMTPVGQNQ